MKYSNGKIYKIVCNITGNCYIGSTCNPKLSQRLAQHRKNYKDYLNGKYNYTTSFDIIENGNYEIILLELFPCVCKEQLLARERYYIETNNCVNKYLPLRTKKEYYEEHKDKIKEQRKEYREKNKIQNGEYFRKYYELHKEQLKLNAREHYHKNKNNNNEQENITN